MKFEGTKISDLKSGEIINGIYVLKSADFKIAANKKTYIDIVFSDKSGDVSAKWWDANKENYDSLSTNRLYYVNAKVDLWRETIQLSINKIQLANEEDQKYISEFVPAAPLTPQEMIDEIYLFAAKIKNTEIRSIIMKLLDDKEEKLLYWPAAKSLHHAIRSGLLYHIVRMLRTAEALCSVYEGVNSDLLYAGVIIHDLSKIGELSSNTLGMADYSKEGKMLGHIIMGVEELDRAGKELSTSDEVLLLLKHMVISHHYEAEYGSPKKPLFLEAELLHHIDMIDARVYDYENAVKNIEPGQFSEPVWSLDRRSVYKPEI
ncbi:MAG: HD domain-containing protein [Clostridiaceae bacterium]|nr:HD domain-containing protein [Clostridiaceae bacterium]